MVIKSGQADSERESASLPSNYDWKVAESRVRRFKNEVDFSRIVHDELKGNKPVGYVEGPPTLNGVPHIGHIRGRIMKDLWYRFSTLSKKNVVFRAGWDCQGLPVELQAEKELGLSGNKWEDLKQIGAEHRDVRKTVALDRLGAEVEQLPGAASVPQPHLLAGGVA